MSFANGSTFSSIRTRGWGQGWNKHAPDYYNCYHMTRGVLAPTPSFRDGFSRCLCPGRPFRKVTHRLADSEITMTRVGARHKWTKSVNSRGRSEQFDWRPKTGMISEEQSFSIVIELQNSKSYCQRQQWLYLKVGTGAIFTKDVSKLKAIKAWNKFASLALATATSSRRRAYVDWAATSSSEWMKPVSSSSTASLSHRSRVLCSCCRRCCCFWLDLTPAQAQAQVEQWVSEWAALGWSVQAEARGREKKASIFRYDFRILVEKIRGSWLIGLTCGIVVLRLATRGEAWNRSWLFFRNPLWTGIWREQPGPTSTLIKRQTYHFVRSKTIFDLWPPRGRPDSLYKFLVSQTQSRTIWLFQRSNQDGPRCRQGDTFPRMVQQSLGVSRSSGKSWKVLPWPGSCHDLLWFQVDGWPLMDSPIPTMIICASYVFIVKVAGPMYMKDRKPMNIRGFLIVYNLFQVILSTYLFVRVRVKVVSESWLGSLGPSSSFSAATQRLGWWLQLSMSACGLLERSKSSECKSWMD